MKLLMHFCCGPCAVYPTSVIQEEGIAMEALFFNPNIHPIDEYERRKENAVIFADKFQIKIHMIDGFMQASWEKFNGTEEKRCNMCYNIRMDRIAEYAKENGFDAFTTSLLVSPYQKHETIIQMAESASTRHNIPFFYRDFRDGFRKGQQMAREMGLYRQKYCGCIISYQEQVLNKKK